MADRFTCPHCRRDISVRLNFFVEEVERQSVEEALSEFEDRLSISEDVVQPKAWLGSADFAKVSGILKDYQFTWISEGRDSRWRRG